MTSGRVLAGSRSTTVGLGTAEVYAFDLEGRPLSWWDGRRTYKRSLASEVHVRERLPEGRSYGVLVGDRAAAAFARVLERAAGVGTPDPKGRERLDRIRAWTPERLVAEKARFDAAYAPISILPPDQYLAVVVQATFGCSWNLCTFCSFYQDRPFRARPLTEIEAHVDAVHALLGEGLGLRRSIFLADGNALILSLDRLLPILDRVRERFPGLPAAGFLDVFTGERREAREWARLRDAGLALVHLGVESGHDPLLAWMEKPAGADATIDVVGALKSAGIRVAIIVMVAAGGDRFAAGHVRDTIRMIDRLPLGPGDVVYLSPFVLDPGSAYRRRADAEGLRPLDRAEAETQYTVFRDAVRRRHPGARVARYDLREFLY